MGRDGGHKELQLVGALSGAPTFFVPPPSVRLAPCMYVFSETKRSPLDNLTPDSSSMELIKAQA
jgi:hypothetical protein